ncbi:MAG: hypothetical protein Q9162_007378 [Coniocarpon cinnabarinum]
MSSQKPPGIKFVFFGTVAPSGLPVHVVKIGEQIEKDMGEGWGGNRVKITPLEIRGVSDKELPHLEQNKRHLLSRIKKEAKTKIPHYEAERNAIRAADNIKEKIQVTSLLISEDCVGRKEEADHIELLFCDKDGPLHPAVVSYDPVQQQMVEDRYGGQKKKRKFAGDEPD